MDDPAEIEDWELLDFPSTPPNPSEYPKPFEVIGASFVSGHINSDYFAPDRARVLSEEEDDGDEGGIDSDNPSSADPDSDSRYEVGSKGEVGFGSNESSLSSKSTPGSENGEIGSVAGAAIDEESGKDSSLGGFGTCNGSDEEVENRGLGERRGDEEVEAHGLDENERRGDDSEPLAEINAGSGSSEIACLDGGEERVVAWWKMPLLLIRYCAIRVKPVWSISVAAAILGLVMLGRRMYKMKHKSRTIPLKIVIDDKGESQLAARAARLNKAFSVVRQVPVIRMSTRAVTLQSIISAR